MSGQDLGQRARELPAAEYERDGKTGSAEHIRTQPLLPNKARAIRAIVAALRQQYAPVDLEQFRGAVLAFMQKGSNGMALHANPASEFERECYEVAAADFDEAHRLLSIIDNVGVVGCPHDAWEETGGARRCADCHKYLGGVPHQPAPVVDDVMVERAAIALSNFDRPHPFPEDFWAWRSEDSRDKYRGRARAALARVQGEPK